ncbi:hypothetical protein mRhiFer1_009649 [Rhinolophus ferrumequinum]|uniref:Uncharacterized protein n=1 Tax=Rhinolophus ferrumequinum TaxID=59479 RepID=A0A7J7R615_RHIFE|nr:hypothetical protein mRhiFer1_009649 [Rhinolophus ferrumequinum]
MYSGVQKMVRGPCVTLHEWALAMGCGTHRQVKCLRHQQKEGLPASPDPSAIFPGMVMSEWTGHVPEGPGQTSGSSRSASGSSWPLRHPPCTSLSYDVSFRCLGALRLLRPSYKPIWAELGDRTRLQEKKVEAPESSDPPSKAAHTPPGSDFTLAVPMW